MICSQSTSQTWIGFLSLDRVQDTASQDINNLVYLENLKFLKQSLRRTKCVYKTANKSASIHTKQIILWKKNWKRAPLNDFGRRVSSADYNKFSSLSNTAVSVVVIFPNLC